MSCTAMPTVIPTLWAWATSSAVPAQKLGVLEENSNGEKGYGGCDGATQMGSSTSARIRMNRANAHRRTTGWGAVRAMGAWLVPSLCPHGLARSKGLKTHNLCLCYSGLLNSNPRHSSTTQCRSAPHLQLTRSVPTFEQCRTRTTANPATRCCWSRM